MTLDDDMLLPLAENLLAAVVAYRLRISLNYALSRYVRGERPGQYWFTLAQQVLEQTNRMTEAEFEEKP